MIYTITYNNCKTKSRSTSVSLDFLEVIDKLDKTLPAEAYVQGVSLFDYIVTVRSSYEIQSLRDIAMRSANENYSVNTVTIDNANYMPKENT